MMSHPHTEPDVTPFRARALRVAPKCCLKQPFQTISVRFANAGKMMPLRCASVVAWKTRFSRYPPSPWLRPTSWGCAEQPGTADPDHSKP